MRIFKTKTFARWMRRQGIEDAQLLGAAHEMERRQFDANPGGSVYKKQIAVPGRGKRGSVRTLIAYRSTHKAFFAFGFAKNERENIDSNELRALKLVTKVLLEKSSAKLEQDLEVKILVEVQIDDQ